MIKYGVLVGVLSAAFIEDFHINPAEEPVDPTDPNAVTVDGIPVTHLGVIVVHTGV